MAHNKFKQFVSVSVNRRKSVLFCQIFWMQFISININHAVYPFIFYGEDRNSSAQYLSVI